MKILSKILLTFLLILCWCGVAFATPPSVPGTITGTISSGNIITIPVTGHGGGPHVILWDDFEKGVIGEKILEGPNAAQVGGYEAQTERLDTTKYTGTYKLSGTKAFIADYTLYYTNNHYKRTLLFPPATELFFTAWMFHPLGVGKPGEGMLEQINFKKLWTCEASNCNGYTGSDYTWPSFLGDDAMPDDYHSANLSGNSCATGRTSGCGFIGELSYAKGNWLRSSHYIKGSEDPTQGKVKLWEMLSTGIKLKHNKVGNTLGPGDYWTRITIPGYGRTGGPPAQVVIDDIYVAEGPNAQARVEIGNSSDYMQSTKMTILTPTVWGTTSIQAKVNLGPFTPGEKCYLFVINSAGEISPAKEITIGASVADTENPQVSSTNPDNNQTGVIKNSNVVINFTEGMQTSLASLVTISPGSGTTTGNGSTYTMVTSGQLDSTEYTITVPITVKDLAGNPLLTAKVFKYTTASPGETCDTDNSLCTTPETCSAAWPTYNYCSDETPSCKPEACTNVCSFENWQLCKTPTDCTNVGRDWWPVTDGACRTVPIPEGMTDINLLTNPNLTAWTGDRPDLWNSYNWAGVLRVTAGASLFNSAGLQKQNMLVINKRYAFVYNHLYGAGTSKSYLLGNHVLNVGPGTYVRIFDTPAIDFTDHSVIAAHHAGEAATINNIGLFEITDGSCTDSWSLCNTPDTCNAAGWSYYNMTCNENPPSIMFENFTDGNATGWTTVNDATGTASWSVLNGKYQQTGVLTGSFGGYHKGSYAEWTAGAGWTDYRINVDSTLLDGIARSEGGIMFRKSDANNYYRLSYSRAAGFYRLEKIVAGVWYTLKVTGRGPSTLNQNIDIEVNGASIIIEVDGIPLFSVTDTSHTTGTVALFSSLGPVDFDNIAISDITTSPKVVIDSPVDYQVYKESSITAKATVINLPVNGYMKFSVDGVESEEISQAPFTKDFTGLTTGNHILTATVYSVDDNVESTDSNSFGTGGIVMAAVGDSITVGAFDDVSIDDASSNGRNIGRGFTPILSSWFESNLHKPSMVYNDGIGGIRTIDANNNLDASISRYPEASYFLILLGTNDSLWSTPTLPGNTCTEADFQADVAGCSGTYKGIMRQIILRLKASGKIPVLALVPFNKSTTSTVLTRIQNYNAANAQLINEHNLAIDAPDFYTYFESNPGQLIDAVHPNGQGYQAVANGWYQEFTNVWSGIFEPNKASTINATMH